MKRDDDKELYSKSSLDYVKNSEADSNAFNKSKRRERRYNDSWEDEKVNINDVIATFTPDYSTKENHQKLIFYGDRYNVVTDMASGYLRVYDNVQKTYVRMNGMPGSDQQTHFKIKRREEM